MNELFRSKVHTNGRCLRCQVSEAQKWAEHFEDPTWESSEAAEETESSGERETAEAATPTGDGEIMCRLDLSAGTSEVSAALPKVTLDFHISCRTSRDSGLAPNSDTED